MIATPCLAVGRRFVVDASNGDPTTGRSHMHDNAVDCETHANRGATNQCARFFLQLGLRVEVYDRDTKELLAEPFDPDQAAPAYIV